MAGNQVLVSQLADRFVRDPKQIVKVGQVVKVRVLEIDAKLKRISLSMRSPDEATYRSPGRSDSKPAQQKAPPPPSTATLSDLQAKFKKRR